MKSKIILLAVVVLLVAPFQSVGAFSTGSAETYLLSKSNNAWSTMALSALGTADIPTDHLKNISGTKAIDYAAPILAITSLKQDPRVFGSKDYVETLLSFDDGNQIGDSSTINDDIFGLLALVASGEVDSETAQNAKNLILANQQPDGGWGFAVSGGSDSNMTAAAITALISSGVASSDSKIANAFNYLKTAQNSDGGFTYDPASSYGTDSDTASTSWVVWAMNAAEVDPTSWSKDNGNPISYLESNQDSSGYFKYQLGGGEDVFTPVTSSYAVIALSGKTLPLQKITPKPSFEFRIEGKDNTVCSGRTAGPTALDVVKNAAKTCDFDYNITETAYGPYLDRIETDEASGLIGWMYLVNYQSPQVGAAEYNLQTGDSVVWFFGDFMWKPTRLTLSQTDLESGQSTTATVEYLEGAQWQELADAKVYFGASETTTSNSGEVVITAPDGFYKIFAQKDGYVRSNSVELQVGEPVNTQVGVKTKVLDAGQVEGATLAFTVDPSVIDFGDLKKGSSNKKNLNIKNTGNVNIAVEAEVAGDDLFKTNLGLGGSSWQNFSKQVAMSQTEVVEAVLSVPANYSGSGARVGQITFWATAK